ncbi:MAG: SDR family oxidoreductase [Acetobacteraceae bacterium]|nr:SDR family oxidoreductase [Acetobacteraceae bacterium]
MGGICEVVAADESVAANVAVLTDACIAAFGQMDVLHYKAEIVEVGGPVKTTEKSWDRVNDGKLKSMCLTCKQVLPHMQRRPMARSSTLHRCRISAGSRSPTFPECGDQAAVIQFTRVIVLQYARLGVRANTILPGMMNTPMVHAPSVIAA